MMTLEQRLDNIGHSLVQLKQRLEAKGYQFEEPSEVLPGPAADVGLALTRLEQEVGAVPLALKSFYQRIGSVNFLGGHPDWEGWDVAYPDPLFVYPISVAVQELEEFLNYRADYIEAMGAFRIPIAPDYYHKADVSGGPCYSIAVPDASEDPRLLDEWHETTFLNYLEVAIRWGGFPGVERWGSHNWPIADLVRGLQCGT